MVLPGSLEYVSRIQFQVFFVCLTFRQLLQGGLGVTGFVSNHPRQFAVKHANHENRMVLRT
jgi:hypothetical protein